MNKPNHESVTELSCECQFLEFAANDPDLPIVFDETTCEYEFQYEKQIPSRFQYLLRALWGGNGQRWSMIIHHCPLCGGAAPKSKRSLLFEKISHAEETRLSRLVENIRTIDDALRQLGQPDFDGQATMQTVKHDGNPPKTEPLRTIRYYSLSNVAEVWFTERPDGSAYWQLQGKPKTRSNED